MIIIVEKGQAKSQQSNGGVISHKRSILGVINYKMRKGNGNKSPTHERVRCLIVGKDHDYN